ncbi:MAG: hypothetical protein JWR50_2612 [Mucilaginibacter sp.]|nr:hypothetical protein [Mucilaginibacter sp.]
MNDIIEFEDRELLYGALAKELNLQKIKEDYYPHMFRDYIITFSAGEFLISYIRDRNQLFVDVASNYDPQKRYFVLTIKNYINRLEKINIPDPNNFTYKSVVEYNEFLRNNFTKIAELLNKENYLNTISQIDSRVKAENLERFKKWQQ